MKDVVLKIKKYINNNKIFIAYLVVSILIGLFLRTITIKSFFSFKAIYTDFLFAYIIGSLGYLFKEKNRVYYYEFIITFLSLLSILNIIYYEFYKSFVSISLLSTASMITRVNDSLLAKVHLYQFSFLLFPISFYIFYKYMAKKKVDKIINYKELAKKNIIVILILTLALICTITKNDIKKFDMQNNRGYIIKKYGLYFYTINDLVKNLELNRDALYDEKAYDFREFYACKEKSNKTNEYTNIFKDKNIIFIHAESIQNFLVDLKINDEYVTPNINKFVHEGMYFKKFYPQISVGTSSDTEFTLMTGLMPSSNRTVFVNYYDRFYNSLPRYFNNMGYYTFSMHANDRNYWNRAKMHESIGYQKFYGGESYTQVIDKDDDKNVGLGLNDKDFFLESIEYLKEIKKEHDKYYGTIITLSNHSPFNDLEKYGEFNVQMEYKDLDGKKQSAPYLEETTMGNYLKSAHYADSAFKVLIDNLKKENLLENTILVFYGDHEARIPKEDFELLYNYDPQTMELKDQDSEEYVSMDNYNYELLTNTPFVIWSNEMNIQKEIDSVMGMYDVLPTIANMFGFKEKYALGSDVFSDQERIVVFPNGNVLTDKVYYSELNEEYIAFTSEPIDTDYINRISEQANEILDISNNIIKYDLIAKEGNNIGTCNEKQ